MAAFIHVWLLGWSSCSSPSTKELHALTMKMKPSGALIYSDLEWLLSSAIDQSKLAITAECDVNIQRSFKFSKNIKQRYIHVIVILNFLLLYASKFRTSWRSLWSWIWSNSSESPNRISQRCEKIILKYIVSIFPETRILLKINFQRLQVCFYFRQILSPLSSQTPARAEFRQPSRNWTLQGLFWLVPIYSDSFWFMLLGLHSETSRKHFK